jgi:hypothetical protein
VKAKYAVIFIAAALTGILIYDWFLFEAGGTEATISWLIYTSSYEHPVMPFSVGLLIGFFSGHLFWQMRKPPAAT